MGQTDLSTFNNNWFHTGRPAWVRLVWFLVSFVFFEYDLFPLYGLKRFLLRQFGATIGEGVVIKQRVTIKYPWNLSIGDNSWIGENVWIDNLVEVSIGKNCCLSQGALLITGSHDYKTPSFDLIVKPIVLHDGAWIGAKSVVALGVTCGSHSVLTLGSVATKDLSEYAIYQGNPALKIRDRIVNEA